MNKRQRQNIHGRNCAWGDSGLDSPNIGLSPNRLVPLYLPNFQLASKMGFLLASIVFLLEFPIIVPNYCSVLAQRFTIHDQDMQSKSTKDTSDENANNAYAALKDGKLDEARKILGQTNLSDPTAMYVRAAFTQNALEAADMYREIVAQNPGKPIAHDALLELYKYHFAMGDYKAAHIDYNELQKYPWTDEIVDPIGFRDSIQSGTFFTIFQRSPAEIEIKAPGLMPEVGEKFLVQVGVFSTPENARRFMEKMRSLNIDAKIFTKIVGGKMFYGVSAGSFLERNQAEAFASNLKSRSINCIVVPK
jgi:tetratricopeptide (TPR) repeat protein